MAISIIDTGCLTDASSASVQLNLDAGSGSDRIVIAWTCGANNQSTPIPKFNGVNMTLIASATAGTWRRIKMFYMLSPPSGVKSLSATFSRADVVKGLGGMSFSGVNGISNPATDYGDPDGSNCTLSIGSVGANDWAVGAVWSGYSNPRNGRGSGQIERFFCSPSNPWYLVGDTKVGNGTITWGTLNRFAAAGARLQVAAVAPEVYAKVSGNWKKCTPSVRVSGVWKSIEKIYVKVSGIWKEV